VVKADAFQSEYYRELISSQKSLAQSQALIAESLQGIRGNLQTLNDQNVLHCQETKNDHNILAIEVRKFQEKWWWLILVLLAAALGKDWILKGVGVG
jgi:hypothetical protein